MSARGRGASASARGGRGSSASARGGRGTSLSGPGPLLRHLGDFRWEGIAVQAYKGPKEPFRDVTRQVLFGPEAGGASELRYFEVAPGGWTTLERHDHVHQVVVLRGRGRALVGEHVLPLGPLDCLRVPPGTWHQLRADSGKALGFLCLVDRERDRPQRPGREELAALRTLPEVAAFIRV